MPKATNTHIFNLCVIISVIAPITILRGGTSAIGAQHQGQKELVVAAVDSVEAAAEVEEVATEADSVAEEVTEGVSEEAEVDQTEGMNRKEYC